MSEIKAPNSQAVDRRPKAEGTTGTPAAPPTAYSLQPASGGQTVDRRPKAEGTAGTPAAAPTGLAPDAEEFASLIESACEANVMACYQCRKCTSGCPVAARTDVRPHELVRLVQLGQRTEAMKNCLVWECTSCQTCVTRCPQKVSVAALNDALRALSRKHGQVVAGTTVPTFNDIFLRTVKNLGRMYEMGLMTSYKLRTMKLMGDVGKFPMMLLKGKLSVLPKFIKGRGERKRLFERARSGGGK